MFGKSVYEVWIEKYGIEEANKKEQERKNKEPFKARAYKNVKEQIKLIDGKVSNMDDLKHIKGIGESIREKIEKIFETNSFKKVEIIVKNDNYLKKNSVINDLQNKIKTFTNVLLLKKLWIYYFLILINLKF